LFTNSSEISLSYRKERKEHVLFFSYITKKNKERFFIVHFKYNEVENVEVHYPVKGDKEILKNHVFQDQLKVSYDSIKVIENSPRVNNQNCKNSMFFLNCVHFLSIFCETPKWENLKIFVCEMYTTGICKQ
jgi:hypothetical protein